jgi:Uma2 family endonuclease
MIATMPDILARDDQPITLGDLARRLGDISPDRIRAFPFPGTATVADAAKTKRCELIDGVLVEKTVGLQESEIGAFLIASLFNFVLERNLGTVAGENGMVEISPNQVRAPDVAFFTHERRNRSTGEAAIPAVVPNLAVEVLSRSNTAAEMDRKVREYFQAGVESVWMVDRRTETIRVYSDARTFVALGMEDTLKGEPTLPGYSIAVSRIFGIVK